MDTTHYKDEKFIIRVSHAYIGISKFNPLFLHIYVYKIHVIHMQL